MARKRKSAQSRNIGLLTLRVGLGGMFILHGYPILFGGPDAWTETGTLMYHFGIHLAPMFFGFIAGATEFFGGLFLLSGLFYTPALSLLLLAMVLRIASGIAVGSPLPSLLQAGAIALICAGLFLTGPGRYNLDSKFNTRRRF